MTDQALQAAVDRWIGGTADEADAALVSRAVRDDPALRDAIAERMLLEAQLRRTFKGAAGATQPGHETRRLAARARRRPRATPWWPWAAAAAVAAAITIAVLTIPGRHPAAPPFGTVVEARFCSSDRGAVAVGETLLQGQAIACTDGAVTIELADGQGRVQVSGGTALLPRTGQALRLFTGTLTAQIAKRDPAAPLRFATSNGEVAIIGTRFTLAVEDALTRLAVSEGRVRLRRPADGASVEVAAEQMVLAGDEGALTVMPASADGGRLLRVGAGQAFARFADLPPLLPGDVIEVAAGTYRESVRLSAAGTAARPITLRGLPGAQLGGEGVGLDGASRALVQVEADHCLVEGLTLSGARNRNGNAAGVRVFNADSVAIRGIDARGCDQGIDIHDCGAIDVESCTLIGNGSPVAGGTGHNLGAERTDRVALRWCDIADALGDNVWSGARWTEIAWCRIADGGNAEVDLLSASGSDQRPHRALIIGSLIHAKAARVDNVVRCIAFGSAGGGSLSLVHDTVISELPLLCVAEAANAQCSVRVDGCVVAGRAKALASGTERVVGAANWIVDGCDVPSGISGTLRGADAQLDPSGAPRAGSPCIDAGGEARSIDADGHERAIAPAFEPRDPPRPTPRTVHGRPDIGAFEAGK